MVPAIHKTVADFSTAFNVDIVCRCLPEFNVNSPETITATSALCACAHARASVPC